MLFTDFNGLKLNRIGLGAMPLAIQGRPERNVALSVLFKAIELGVNVIDAADCYCQDENDFGYCEELVAEQISVLNFGGLISTKGGLKRPKGAWIVDSSPEYLVTAIQQSLKNLKVEQIPVYFLHAPGSNFENSVKKLADLKKDGLIRWLGLSNVSPEQYRAAQKIVGIDIIQNEFSYWHRADLDTGFLKMLKADGVLYYAYSPVGGYRSHKLKQAQSNRLFAVAASINLSTYEASLLWCLAASENVIVIPGSSRLSTLEANQKLHTKNLNPDQIEAFRSL